MHHAVQLDLSSASAPQTGLMLPKHTYHHQTCRCDPSGGLRLVGGEKRKPGFPRGSARCSLPSQSWVLTAARCKEEICSLTRFVQGFFWAGKGQGCVCRCISYVAAANDVPLHRDLHMHACGRKSEMVQSKSSVRAEALAVK